jgi:hypothetical protein
MLESLMDLNIIAMFTLNQLSSLAPRFAWQSTQAYSIVVLSKTTADQASLSLRQNTLEDLVKNFDDFFISSLSRMTQ